MSDQLRHSRLNSSERHFVNVNSYDRVFVVECERKDDAEFLQAAVECYVEFEAVEKHMKHALAKIQRVDPRRKI